MLNETRKLYNQYKQRLAELNGIDVEDTSSKFNVVPEVEQKLEGKIRESSGFLQRINVVNVTQQEGEKVGIDSGNTIASTTDTTGNNERQTQDVSTTDNRRYRCEQTNYDTHLRYAKLDMWRHKPNFQPLVADAVNRQIARDRLMIGMNGTSRAATSDRVANPMLQDVNVGWLQRVRDNKPASVLAGKKIGDQAGADYKNIDAAVYDATNELIAEWYQDDPDLVVVCGRKLLSDKYLTLIDSNDLPTERNALDMIIANKKIGGLPAVRVPFFLASGFMITRLDNLSIYLQNGTTRRSLIDVSKRDRIEEYRSNNECYEIEDYNLICLSEGILTPDGAGGWS